MSVSLVKITPATVVYIVGYSYGPCSPDPDHVHAYATIASAREALADELERAAEQMMEQEMDAARAEYQLETDYTADIERAHEASTSISGSAELVKSDRDNDITYSVIHYGGWSTSEPDGYNYWVNAATIGQVFGDDTDSDEYLDLIDELLGR